MNNQDYDIFEDLLIGLRHGYEELSKLNKDFNKLKTKLNEDQLDLIISFIRLCENISDEFGHIIDDNHKYQDEQNKLL
jgi:hypothetical protein